MFVAIAVAMAIAIFGSAGGDFEPAARTESVETNVVFIGDSGLAYLGHSTAPGALINQIFPTYQNHNLSAEGTELAYSAGTVEIVTSHEPAHYDWAVVYVGLNDEIASREYRVDDIISALRSGPGVTADKILAITVPRPDPTSAHGSTMPSPSQERMDRLNSHIIAAGADVVVPFGKIDFSAPVNHGLTSDGWHLTQAGYEQLGEMVMRAIQEGS